MERSQYKERYALQDPRGSESRSTQYRANKRRREQENEQRVTALSTAAGSASDSAVLDDCEVVEPRESRASQECDPSVTPESGLLGVSRVCSEDINCDQPQLLEIEAFGVEDKSQPLSEDSGDEQSEQCTYAVSFSADSSDPPLYDGARLTLSTSNILIMQYKMRHKLTDECLADLLQLLKLHCPTPNRCLQSTYYFKKHFSRLTCPIQFHYFCSTCFQSVNQPQVSKRCPNPLCRSDITEAGARSSFIEIPIESQLQTLFERKYTCTIMTPCTSNIQCCTCVPGEGFYTTLYEGFRDRCSSTSGSFRDICDGTLYKKLASQGFFSIPSNISVTFNTDGIPVFKSSGFCFWPLYLCINELPYKMRYGCGT